CRSWDGRQGARSSWKADCHQRGSERSADYDDHRNQTLIFFARGNTNSGFILLGAFPRMILRSITTLISVSFLCLHSRLTLASDTQGSPGQPTIRTQATSSQPVEVY